MKWIIDCDPGLDDLLALGYAFDRGLDMAGITVTAGNVSLEKTFINARKAVELFGKKIPVFKGASEPLFGGRIEASDVHGEDGAMGVLTDLPVPGIEEGESEDSVSAYRFMRDMAELYPGELAICAVGPLSNVALFLLNYPESGRNISKIVIMGGGHAFGNHTPNGEFNILADPFAAKVVFESGIPIEMVGLDATMHDGLTDLEVSEIARGLRGDKPAEIMAKVLEACGKVHAGFGYEKVYIHDLVAVMSIFRNDLLEYKDFYVTIETRGELTYGKTVLDVDRLSGKDANTRVALSLDRDVLLEEIKNWLCG